jgi:hypothetical protein
VAAPWGGLGATRWRWRRDVRAVVAELSREFPAARPNTYVGHPWVGWGRVSVDFWGPGGRGDPIQQDLGWQLLHYAFRMPGKPNLRHTIFLHQLWTSYGGYSFWRPDDHSGALRHVHLTYWK